jgi:hypothetical protein
VSAGGRFHCRVWTLDGPALDHLNAAVGVGDTVPVQRDSHDWTVPTLNHR